MPTNFSGYPYVARPKAPSIPKINELHLDGGGASSSSSRQGTPPITFEQRMLAASNAADNSPGIKPGKTYLSDVQGDLTGRYDTVVHGSNNENAWGGDQTWGSKMVSGVGKGLLLAGTTFLQSTAGLLNGLNESRKTGKASSFYDNDFNRSLDELNKKAENYMPNYYTDVEKNAHWYSPDKLFTANFLWDGIVKNMGFAAGAALAGGVFTAGLKALPLTARLFSVGKGAEALIATEEGLLATNKVASTYGKVKALSDSFLGSYSRLNIGGRALVAGISTTGEASMEAYQNLNVFREQKIQEYKDANGGEAPLGKDLAVINELADGVGNSTFALNVALLSVTNYIQFPKILGSTYKGESGLIKGFGHEVNAIEKDAVSGVWSLAKAKTRVGKVLSTLNKIRPYTFSASEGFEEGAQFAISEGTKDFFSKKTRNNSEALKSAIFGINKTLTTDEGMENIVTGGLSGMLMMRGGELVQGEGATKRRNTNELLTALNKYKMSDFSKETLDAVERGVTLQEEREHLLKTGDKFGSKSKEADYTINYLLPRVKFGRMDLVKADIEDYTTLASTDEGFNQLVEEGKALATDTREAYLDRLQNFKNTAEGMESLYQSLTLRYGNKATLDGKPLYTPLVMNQMMYAGTKIDDYTKRITDTISQIPGVDVDQVMSEVIKGDDTSYEKALVAIDANDALMPEKKTDAKEALRDVAKMAMYRDMHIKEYLEFRENPLKHQVIDVEDTTIDEEGKPTVIAPIEVKGKVPFETGVEYIVGKPLETDENGVANRVASKLTIVKKNDDNTYEVRDKNGLRTISEETLNNLNLGKATGVKADFFSKMADIPHSLKVGKRTLKGNLEFDPITGIMEFVHENKKGEITREEVTADQFRSQRGETPAVVSLEDLSPEQEAALEAFKSFDDIRTAKKFEKHSQVLGKFLTELNERQEKTNALIEQAKKNIERSTQEAKEQQDEAAANIDKRYKKLTYKEAGKTALSMINRLTRDIEKFKNEIDKLENDLESIETTASYVKDLLGNLESYSADVKVFEKELKQEVSNLDMLYKTTEEQISTIKKLILLAEDALKAVRERLENIISQLAKNNPEIAIPEIATADPTLFDDYIKELEASTIDQLNKDLIDIVDKEEISLTSVKIFDLFKKLNETKEVLAKLDVETKAKKEILARFDSTIKEIKKGEGQVTKLGKNTALVESIKKTHDQGFQTSNYNNTGEFEQEPKKDTPERSTISSTTGIKNNVPYAVRAQRFGFNFFKYKKAGKSFRGTVVTLANEEKLGLQGLIKTLNPDGSERQLKRTIALVITNENGELIDKEGNVIPDNVSKLDHFIAQVFPEEELVQYYNGVVGTMFQNNVHPDERLARKNNYIQWRTSISANTELNPLQNIDASFGHINFIQILSDKAEKGKTIVDKAASLQAKSNVLEAGLITETDLEQNQVIIVATSNDTVTNGSVHATTPMGRVFLAPDGGLVSLRNKKFSTTEANIIYDVIHQITKNIQEKSKVDSEKNKILFDWLKSTVFWGVVDNPNKTTNTYSKNNIWFDTVYIDGKWLPKLFIGGTDISFDFTPVSLESEDNKLAIISALTDMYNNVQNYRLDKTNFKSAYWEIIGIDSEGKPKARKWNNYQTYLLSNKTPSGAIRNNEDIPLTSNVAPIVGESMNRDGVYFTVTDAMEIQKAPKIKKTKTVQEPVGTPPTPKGRPVQKAKEVTEIKYNGENNLLPIGENPDDIIVYQFYLDKALPLLTSDTFTNEEATDEFINKLLKEDILIIKINEGSNTSLGTAAKVAASKGISEASATRLLIKAIFGAVSGPMINHKISEENASEEDSNDFDNDLDQENEDDDNDVPFRLEALDKLVDFKEEDWVKAEQWLRTNFPSLPVYRLKNIIQATNGMQAFGMFKDAALYLYNNAEEGTVYHEVFHAVWKMFAKPKEQSKIIKEFRSKKGTFTNRITGEQISYKDATAYQLEDELAENFRELILENKEPVSFLRGLFNDMVEFFNKFFLGKESSFNTRKLFNKIGNGYYAKYNQHESALSLAKTGFIYQDSAKGQLGDDFRIDIPSGQIHELVQHMTYSIIKDLIKTNQGLFELTDKLKGGQIYSTLQQEILGTKTQGGKIGIIRREIKALKLALKTSDVGQRDLKLEDIARRILSLNDLHKKITANWPAIVEKHKQHLLVYDIVFDENEEALVNDENSTGADYFDSNKIDVLKKADLAVKLLFATLPDTYKNGPLKGRINPSTIGGSTLMGSDKVFITLLNKLHNSVDVDDMLDKLKILAKQDDNYAALYSRLTKVVLGAPVTGENFTDNDIRLVNAFWKVINKQNPDVLTVEVLPEGKIVIGDTNLTSVAKQERYKMINTIVDIIKNDKTDFFEYDLNGKYSSTSVIKDFKLDAGDISTYIDFLSNLGIVFNQVALEKLFLESPRQKLNFFKSIEGIKLDLSNIKNTPVITKGTLNSNSNLAQLGTIKGLMDNPVFESTFFGINGERIQTFIGVNFPSMVYDILKKVSHIRDLDTTRLRYLNTDAFAKGSMVFKKMFTSSGEKIAGTEDIMMPVYTDGIIDQETGDKTETTKQNYKQRLLQEIALNQEGVYLNLVPGDSNLDHAMRLHHKGDAFVTKEGLEYKEYHEIFENYFLSEIALVQEDRVVASNRNSGDMRFFKDILGKELHKDIIDTMNGAELSGADLYGRFEEVIKKQVDKFISEQTNLTKKLFYEYGIIARTKKGEDSFTFQGVTTEKINEAEVNKEVKLSTINYMIANIELHKLIYSDPYIYKDELKRIKNYNSPRQALLADSKMMLNAMDKVYNKDFTPDSLGYTKMREYFRTATVGDIWAVNDLKKYDTDLDAYEETDGGGIITLKAYRIFRIRSGDWSPGNEAQYRHDVKYEEISKQDGVSPEEIAYELKEHEDSFTPVKNTYTPIKPIVSGSKDNGRSYNDQNLDKYALIPYSYRILHKLNPTSNAIKMYDKMMYEDLDYIVYESGRKAGTELVHQIFNKNGRFNEAPFESIEQAQKIEDGTIDPSEKRGITNLPFSIISVQTDVPSKDNNKVTQGSQITKLVTLDFMEGGIPIDFATEEEDTDYTFRWIAWMELSEEQKREKSELYGLIQTNREILETRLENGYNDLMSQLGLEELKGNNGYAIKDRDKLVKTLKTELFKREVNDNLIAALNSYETEDVVLESTTMYQQIRHILYSISDSNIARPTITGGLKVQISSNMLESNKVVAFEKNEKTYFKSDILKFYEKGEVNPDTGKVNKTTVAEVMIGRWFKSPLSDKELLEYLNNSDEGQQILKNVAFRVPTQKQNSIDSFIIKQFLPQEFGDSVVVPSALVKKAGSDFDIDKLSVYLKNVFINFKGEPKLIKFLTKENSTVEERYITWVKENASLDTKKYVKFLSEDERKKLIKDFSNRFAELSKFYKSQTSYQFGREYDLYKEGIAQTKKNIFEEQDILMKQLFTLGTQAYHQLSEASLQKFRELHGININKNIKGPEEIETYLALVIGLIENKDSVKIIDRFDLLASISIKEDKENLMYMKELYEKELSVLGVSDAAIKEHMENALVTFRESKTSILDTIKEKIIPASQKIKEEKELAQDELSLERAKEIAEIDDLPTIEAFDKRSIYQQNVPKALDNAYIQSLEDLITHPANFKHLIKPNSAKPLKELSIEIKNKINTDETMDSTSPGFMLSRPSMSKLRQDFLEGKQGIGIAAVGQTNHAQNQRSLIILNVNNIPKEDDTSVPSWLALDRHYLGDGQVLFKTEEGEINYNAVNLGGTWAPTLSMAKNKANHYISDIIGMFIDGYVDISKGAWIMELGATPRTASTWLFLIKLGVPVRDISYFINQPIIREYLRQLDKNGIKGLRKNSIVKSLEKGDYKGNGPVFNSIKYSDLESMLDKTTKEMSPQELSSQVSYLKEFLKYATMAQHLLMVTQGTNMDTAQLNDPLLVYKKQKQLKKARLSIFSGIEKQGEGFSLIPAADAILSNSFVGPLDKTILKVRDSLAEILITDKKNNSVGGISIRSLIQKVADPYTSLSDRTFLKISQKIVADLFDWAVQTNTKMNTKVREVLIGTDTQASVATQVMAFKTKTDEDVNHKLHGNILLSSLVLVSGKSKLSPDNLSIEGRDNKVYDQNQIISSFEEVKDYLKTTVLADEVGLYDKLLSLVILQSGLSVSPISFTKLIPFEDLNPLYNNTLSTLESIPNLNDFYSLNVFERNNWNNTEIVTFVKTSLIESDFSSFLINPATQYNNPALIEAYDEGKLPFTCVIPTDNYTDEFITYGETDNSISREDRIKMRKNGDTSYIKKFLMRRVNSSNNTPLIHTIQKLDGTYDVYTYVAINAWGDSFRAQEMYSYMKVIENGMPKQVIPASVLDNGYQKVIGELDIAGNQISSFEVTDAVINNIIYEYDLKQNKIAEEAVLAAEENFVEDTFTENDYTKYDPKDVTLSPKGKKVTILGKSYTTKDVNGRLLEFLGYSPNDIGEILKRICKG